MNKNVKTIGRCVIMTPVVFLAVAGFISSTAVAQMGFEYAKAKGVTEMDGIKHAAHYIAGKYHKYWSK
jgi:hypothetical protein